MHRIAAEVIGVRVSTLVYGWVREAYYAACDAEARGVDPNLPQREALAQKLSDVQWYQRQGQYEACRDAITRHGSTMEAVVNAAARRLVAGGGSLESQRMPSELR